MQNEIKVKGYKAMNRDMTCRGFQFKVGETFKHDGPVVPCHSGFHFCRAIGDIYGHYPADCRVFLVEASGIVVDHFNKTVTDTLTIVKEIDYNSFVNHDSVWVRRMLIKNGVGLLKFAFDSNVFVANTAKKELVKKFKKFINIFFS